MKRKIFAVLMALVMSVSAVPAYGGTAENNVSIEETVNEDTEDVSTADEELFEETVGDAEYESDDEQSDMFVEEEGMWDSFWADDVFFDEESETAEETDVYFEEDEEFAENTDVFEETDDTEFLEEDTSAEVPETVTDEVFSEEQSEVAEETETSDIIEEEQTEEQVGVANSHVHKYTGYEREVSYAATGHYETVRTTARTMDHDIIRNLILSGKMTSEEANAGKVFETHVVCSCGEWLDADENGNYISNEKRDWNIAYHASQLGHWYESDRIFLGYTYPVEEKKWVEDKPAGTEIVTVYQCECGETKTSLPVDVGTGQATTAKTKYAYTGNEVKPAVTVTVNGKTLNNGTDYVLVYSNNKEVGTATVTANGRGSYQGTISTSFEIAKTDLSKAEVTTYYKEYGYTGAPRKPHITVKLNGTTLTQDTDYTVTYQDNQNVGMATAFVTGIGKYTGKAVCTFSIVRFDIGKGTAWTNKQHGGVYAYSGREKTPHLYVKYDNVMLEKNKDYTLTYKNNIEVGTATVTANGIGMYQGTISATFKIQKIDIRKGKMSLSGTYFTYNGKEQKPTVKLVVANFDKKEKTLQEGRDYTLTYLNNKNVGLASVSAKGIGTYEGIATKTFEISQYKTIPVYRLFNKRSGEHFYTTSAYERDVCVKTGIWNAEGIAWYSPEKSDYPVYRLANPNGGWEHHYTKSKVERDWLVGLGWRYEGISFYSTATGIPVYRHYHPIQRTGNHHYTTSKGESDHIVAEEGWRYEGVSWHVAQAGKG